MKYLEGMACSHFEDGGDCDAEPTIIILTGSAMPVGTMRMVPITVALGYCVVHAAAEVHEARQCHAEDEFIVINLSAEARLESVRKYVIDSEPGIMRADRTDILAIINGDVPATTLEDGCGDRPQSYEDYLSDEPNAYGIPDGLTRAEYEARYLATFGGAL